ncbi:MAG TPA: hypothetical protein V6D18_09265 [Thermosynechococcaceae cyanobacterium]
MDNPQHPFGRIHYFFRKADYAQWHRQESKRHILRAQLGFTDAPSSRPKSCRGCVHYHGLSYGRGSDRSSLICGFHPYGWQSDACPDWGGAL